MKTTLSIWRVWIRRITMGLALLVASSTLLLRVLWEDRPSLDEIDWPTPASAATLGADTVTATWLGVTTLLFDDGETQILIDGFFSRPSPADIVFDQALENDAAMINFALNRFRMRRLAAIIPVHSHFDHAMDVGAIANRSRASVLGSESTAQIARGADVPEDQIIIASDGQTYRFGQFDVTMVSSRHAPLGWGGTVPLDGSIDERLVMPEPVSEFRMGGAWSVIIGHPQGTALVQGSAGFRKYRLRESRADVVFLAVGLLDTIGRDHTELYWQHTVTATGARTVYPIHFDDYTRPFGETEPFPRILSDITKVASWLEQSRDRWDRDTSFYLPKFGEPFAIYASAAAGD